MAYSIGSMVLYGELRSTHRNTVFGTIVTRGRKCPITFRLAGNCGDALSGRHVLFGTPQGEESHPDDIDLSVLASEQCGPLAVGTVARDDHPSQREKGPQDVLVLEWFGQNGLVRVDIPGVTLEECNDSIGQSDASPQPGGVLFDSTAGRSAISSPLARLLDERAQGRILRPVSGDDLYRFDFETVREVDFVSVFEEPLDYRHPDLIPEEELEFELARLLLQFAYHGFAVDICEHASSEEVYRYLVEDVIPSKGEFSQETFLNATTHYSFHERCASCQRELDECCA